MMSYLLIAAMLQVSADTNVNVDCNKTTSQAENLICAPGAHGLRMQDSLMSDHYKYALERSGGDEEKSRLIIEQKQWEDNIKKVCETESCLNKVYQKRIDELAKWHFIDPYCGDMYYPSYPDVWGYRMSELDGSGNKSIGSIYKIPSGEVWLSYTNTTNNSWHVQCVFSGNSIREMVGQQYAVYARQHDNEYKGGWSVRLADGSIIESSDNIYTGVRCTPGYGHHITLRAPDGHTIKRISLLVKPEMPYKREQYTDCEGADGRSYTLMRVLALIPSSAVLLKDGTLIIRAYYPLGNQSDIGYVIRLDKYLNTKFSDKNFYIVDYDKIDNEYLQGGGFQELSDRIYRMVMELNKH